MRKVTWKDRIAILSELIFMCVIGSCLAVAGIYYGAAFQ